MDEAEHRPGEEPWSEGPSIGDPRLAATVADVWAEALRMTGEDATVEPPRSFVTAQRMVAEASMALLALLDTPADDRDLLVRQSRAGHHLATISAVAADLREAAFAHRVRAFGRVQAAGARLRGLGTAAAVLEAAAREACRCGFDRALVLRVQDSQATMVSAFDVSGRESTEQLVAAARRPFHVEPSLPEAEVLRRRIPLLVADAATLADGHRELIAATGTRSYVAAPLISGGRVLGIVIADGRGSRRVVDTFDRDLLWLFARELGTAHERATLVERLGALRQEIRRANQSILTVMDEFADADVQLARLDEVALSQSAATVFVTPDSRIDRLLTRRELDVAALMAAGDTNAGIAAKLVVSEATVKSHVKHILRKLRASNRAEAVSRILAMTGGIGPLT